MSNLSMTTLLVAVLGVGGVGFLLWCLYNFHCEGSRPRSTGLTALGSTKAASRPVIELPERADAKLGEAKGLLRRRS